MNTPRDLSPKQVAFALEMHEKHGARAITIARRLHCSCEAVARAIYGDAINGDDQIIRRAAIYPNQNIRPPAEVLAERDRRKALERQSLTAHLMGDPLPGQSALDQRSEPL